MRTRGIRVILAAMLFGAAALTSEPTANAAEPVQTTISHMAWIEKKQGVPSADLVDDPSCYFPLNADVWEPAASGKYPVAIVTVGTAMPITAPAYQELAKEFADQGFVAVVVDYNTFENIPILIHRIKAKANCTYSSSQPESVMTKVCARAKADCNKGIVTSGHSQGGALALLGYDYDPRVAAAHVWGMGDGERFYKMDMSKVRVIAGETDPGGKTRDDLNKMTGLTCTDHWKCFDGRDGSGWRRVQNDEVTDEDADHCFTTIKRCWGEIDPNALDASRNWSYPATVTWLKSFVTL